MTMPESERENLATKVAGIILAEDDVATMSRRIADFILKREAAARREENEACERMARAFHLEGKTIDDGPRSFVMRSFSDGIAAAIAARRMEEG